MKKKKMLEAFSYLDDKYIEEAKPVRSKARIRFSVLAACACVAVMSAALWMFIPFRTTPPDVSRYKDSEYYALISTLNETTFKKPEYKNNFEKIFSNIAYGLAIIPKTLAESQVDYASRNTADAPGNSEGTQNYVETTDNQVAGVIEADLIKRSDRYIYYLRKDELSVYTIEGENSASAGTFTFENKDKYSVYNSEFYLSDDCKTVTVIRNCYGSGGNVTEVVSLDISSPEKITEKNKVVISGAYVTSRLTGGELIMINSYRAETDANFSKLDDFVPYVEKADGRDYVSADKIYIPENNVSGTNFVVVCLFDEATLVEKGSYSFFNYYTDAYVSEENIYLFRNYTDRDESENIVTNTAKSDIACLSYSDGLELVGEITVDGSVLNQYSLDEKDGTLRAFTSTNKRQYAAGRNNYLIDYVDLKLDNRMSASLYVISIDNMQVVAEVEDFAPAGESVRSARFRDDTAYVCTAVNVTDPVFFFDLSDIGNITYKATEDIDGFSTSLIELKDGYLLGIGISDWRENFKAEIYREGTHGVLPVCKFEIEFSSYSKDYKSYFIDRENNLFGLGINYTATDVPTKTEGVYSSVYKYSYLLLHFDGEKLTEAVLTDLPGDNDVKRAALVDGYFYMFSDEAFKVVKLEY